MREKIKSRDDEPTIPLSVALLGLKPDIPPPSHAHLTGAVTRLLKFPEGVWAEIEIDGAPLLYREFRVPIPLHNEDGTITRLHEGEHVSILVRPRLRL
jgi:hypothetical protein